MALETKAMLDLSTAHVPGPAPHFGTLRYVQHEYGWIVFTNSERGSEEIPEWLRPIHRVAVDRGCMLINFDADADECGSFARYYW